MEKQICPWIIESDSFCLEHDDPVEALKRKQLSRSGSHGSHGNHGNHGSHGSRPVLRVQSAKPMKKEGIYRSQRLIQMKEVRGKSDCLKLESGTCSALMKSNLSTKAPYETRYEHFQPIQFHNIQSKSYCSLRVRSIQIHSKKEQYGRNPLEKRIPNKQKTVQLNQRIRALLTNSRLSARRFPFTKDQQLIPSLVLHRIGGMFT